ncbi:MAG: MarC family protein [Bdellovibrionales bacterium]|nr:MarC family protein [Oligoflexia bacterium]
MLQSFMLSFTAVFVALDIIGAIPIYLSMTRDLTVEARDRVVNTSMLVALVVATIFVFIGKSLFGHLGINLYDFKIAGGLILLLISLADLLSGPEAQDRGSGSTGIVPLAVPLITGPGVLTTLVLQVADQGYWITLAALLSNYLIAWVLLRKCDLIKRMIGKDGTVVLSKIAALLLAALAVAMIRSGVFEAISSNLHSH